MLLLASPTNAPWSTTWVPGLPGDYTLEARAFDAQGQTGISAPVAIRILPQAPGNRSPKANWDYPVVLMNSVNNVLRVLDNDTDEDGDLLTITEIIPSTTPEPHGTPQIIENGKAVSYTPPHGLQGYPADGFSYRIFDGRGGTSLGGVYVTVFASEVPRVSIVAPPSSIVTNAGAIVPITAQVLSDPRYITWVEFFLGKTSIGMVTNGSSGAYTLNWQALSNTCGCGITATAYDRFGQMNTSESIDITVTNKAGVRLPLASLDTYTNVYTYASLPLTNGVVIRDGIFGVYGSAYHPQGSNDVTWQLTLTLPDGTLLRDLTPPDARSPRKRSTGSVFLTNCDLTTLDNGVYNLKLVVTGGFGEAETNMQFVLESNLKLGQFGFSQQDLAIPTAGIPLTVVRTYNSLNPLRGDFGYGWTYSLMDMQATIDETREETIDFNGQTFSQRSGGGRDVTLTLPDGRRTTFTFTYRQGALGRYYAEWKPAPGVTATLTPLDDNTLQGILGVSDKGKPYWQAGDPLLPIENFDFSGFTLKTLDGTRYVLTRDDLAEHYMEDGYGGYDVQAWGNIHLSQIIERSGETITLEGDRVVYRDAANNPTRKIVFRRNEAGLISGIYDPNSLAGRDTPLPTSLPLVAYQYDAQDNLIQVLTLVDRSAGAYLTNSFAYTNAHFPHYITGIIDPRGVPVARNEYDDQGRLTAVVDADGKRTQFIHNLTNNLEVVIDRLGHTNSFVYDLRGNITAETNALGGIKLMAFDDNNNKTNEVAFIDGQPYATNRYVFDTNNLLLVSYDPLGYSNVFAYNDYGQVTNSIDARGYGTTNYYDYRGNLIATVDALGNSTASFYNDQGFLVATRDAVGAWTTNTYDSSGNLTGTAVYGTLGVILSTNSFGFDASGNRTSEVTWHRSNGQWQGATNTYVFDAQNRVVQTIDPCGFTNSVVYNKIGKQAQTIDKLGRATSFDYDAQGRLWRTTYPDLYTETVAFDVNGNRTNSLDRAGHPTDSVFDALNRLTRTVFADGATNGTVFDDLGRAVLSLDSRGVAAATGFDAAGRRTSLTNALGTAQQAVYRYLFDPNGNQTVSFDPSGTPTTNVFDALNQLVEVQFAGGTCKRSGFDAAGRRVAETNEDNIVTLFGFDGMGRLVTVTNAVGTTNQSVSRYEWDEAGNQTAQIDALNRTNRFGYDRLGRRLWHTLPDGTSTEWFGYDAVGNLIRHTNFNGVVVTNQYDLMNRLTNVSSIGGFNIRFTYAPTGPRLTMADGSGITSYEHDSRDRLRLKTVAFGGGPTLSLNYAYDLNGNLTNLWSGSAGGVNLQYAHDALNRITNVLANGALAARYSFDANGNLQGIRYGNGLTNLCQFDLLNRLTNSLWKSDELTLASFYYQLGASGSRTNLTETLLTSVTNRNYSWAYDSLYRLRTEAISGLGKVSYGLDAVGNRTNRLSFIGNLPSTTSAYSTNDWVTTDSYDANGNTTASGANACRYDPLNRLTNFNNGAVLLGYDGDGNRVKKTADGTVTFFLTDDRNPSGYAQVLEEHVSINNQPSTLSRSYSFGLALISQREAGGALCYFVADGHGSTRLLADGSGAVVNALTYDAYGNLIASNATPQTAQLYCGEYFDSDLQTYYLRARYYSPTTGRFWTMDAYEGEKEDPQSLHKYIFCEDNPVDSADPSGNYVSSTGLGQRVHSYLGNEFISRPLFPNELRWSNKSIRRILRERFPNQNKPSLFSVASLRRPDLASAKLRSGEVYEIKPAPGVLMDPLDIVQSVVEVAVQKQLGDYITELQKYSPPGFKWTGGTSFAMGIQSWPKFQTGLPGTQLVTIGMYSQVYGVIYYTILPTRQALEYGLGAAAAYSISDVLLKSRLLINMGIRASGARASASPAVVPIGGVGIAVGG